MALLHKAFVPKKLRRYVEVALCTPTAAGRARNCILRTYNETGSDRSHSHVSAAPGALEHTLDNFSDERIQASRNLLEIIRRFYFRGGTSSMNEVGANLRRIRCAFSAVGPHNPRVMRAEKRGKNGLDASTDRDNSIEIGRLHSAYWIRLERAVKDFSDAIRNADVTLFLGEWFVIAREKKSDGARVFV